MTTASKPTVDPRAEYIAGLRMLADVLEANPELKLPPGESNRNPLNVYLLGDNSSDKLADWARALPGTKAKQADDTWFNLRGTLRGLHISVKAYRDDVCERVVVGTREVTEEIPDPALIADIPIVPVTRTEDIVEWRCHSILDNSAAAELAVV